MSKMTILHVFINYVPNLKAIGTPTGYRLAEPSSLPLYPDEVIEFDRFTITLPSIKQKEIFENTTVSLELYFGQHGKCSEKKTRISDLIQYK